MSGGSGDRVADFSGQGGEGDWIDLSGLGVLALIHRCSGDGAGEARAFPFVGEFTLGYEVRGHHRGFHKDNWRGVRQRAELDRLNAERRFEIGSRSYPSRSREVVER